MYNYSLECCVVKYERLAMVDRRACSRQIDRQIKFQILFRFIIVYLNKSWNLREFGNIAQNGVHEILVYFFLYFCCSCTIVCERFILIINNWAMSQRGENLLGRKKKFYRCVIHIFIRLYELRAFIFHLDEEQFFSARKNRWDFVMFMGLKLINNQRIYMHCCFCEEKTLGYYVNCTEQYH